MIDDKSLSSYLDDLPAIYRQESTGGRPDFLGRFLLAFEHLLTGVGDSGRPGLEETLEGITGESGEVVLAGAHRYFTPGPGLPPEERAPAEPGRDFLEWLSGWVALTLREDWQEEERRRILAEIVPSYRKRGTRDGLRQILAAFTGVRPETITIAEFQQPFQLGRTATVGEDTVLGGGPPHYFMVRVLLPGAADLARRRAILRAIIDMEKPAHTYYDLRIIPTLTMRVGKTSTVGQDTVLGVPEGGS
ncbi:MAG TPA: phage tail protein [Thermoanaerobaculia bacterium]|nr:phage tail protein [Thermoanaerobaculia bacterium]